MHTKPSTSDLGSELAHLLGVAGFPLRIAAADGA
jgi:hypothetical protein